MTVALGSETDGKWQEVSLKELTAKYIAITVETPGANVGEIGLCDSNGNPMTVLQVANAEGEAGNTAGYMFDEQEYIPNEIIDPTFWVVDKYADAIGYYHYASINAFNTYTMFGLNWGTIPTFTLFGMDIAWGTVALVVICVGIVILQWRSRERRPFFDIAAFLVISVFMLMHGMHERYMIPACVCLIFAYIYSRDSVTLCFAAAFSVYALLNEMLTLYASSVVAPETPTLILSGIGVVMYLVYAVVTVRRLWSRKVLIKTPAMQG